MRHCSQIWLLSLLAVGACGAPRVPESSALSAPQAAAIIDSVRTFANSVALGVTQHGPGAWRTYFADTAAFFMVADGRLVFPSSDSATRGIEGLKQIIAHIELHWGDSVRVDALAPGLAMMAAPWHEVTVDQAGRRVEDGGFFTGLVEHRAGGWRFRDAHWSAVAPPAKVP